MPSRVAVEIVATDNASATLEKVRTQLEMFPTFASSVGTVAPQVDKASRSFADFDISVSKATRAARGLAVPLLSELSPALGATAGAMGQAVSSALLLGSGLGALTIAASAVAGIIGGAFITSWREAAQRLEEFDKVQKSLNFTVVSEGLTKERVEVSKLTDEVDGLQQALTELRGVQEQLRGTEFFAGDVPGNDVAALEAKLEDARKRLAAASGRVQAFGRGRAAGEAARAEGDDAGQGALTDPLAQENRRRLENIRKQVTEVGILDPIARQFEAAIREAETVRNAPGGGPEQGAIADEMRRLAAVSRDEALRQRNIKLRLGGDAGYDEGLAYGITPEDIAQGSFAAQRKAFEGQEPAGTPGLDDVAEFEGLSPQTGVDTTRARKIVSDADLRDSERLLQIDRDRLLLAAQRTDLSVAERAALDAEAIQADYLLKIDQARGDAAKEFSAEVEKRVRLQQLLERTDAVAGLKRGISDVEQEFGNAGTRMQEAARTVGGDIARSLSDAMLGPVEERLKNLPPLFRSILTSLTRAVTDDIGKAITAQLFSGFKGLLGGSGGGTPGLTPFDGAGSGGGGPADITNVTLNVAGRPLAQSELDTAYSAGGEAGVRALRGGASTADILSGDYGRQSFDRSLLADPSASIASTGRGFFATALPIAGSAAALGLTAFSAQGARTGFDVGSSAVLGGFTGASLGQSLAPLLGLSGTTGAAGGALAGAAITGTMAALAKAEADKQAAKQRQAAEVARAAGAGSDLVSSAGQAQSLPDLFRRLTAFGSGTTGGSANPAVVTTVDTPQGAKMIGQENPVYPTATLSDLLANPGSIKANIQAGVSPESLAGPNAATSTALQQMATDLVSQFREREQGIGVTEEDVVMPSGLRRRTTVPASRAAALGDGGDLEIDELALNALSDDDQAAVLLDVLGQTAQERDIVSTISDGATGKIVSITRIPRSTITLPPATTPVPAPVNTGTPGPTTPPPSTGELITAGGITALGLGAMLSDPNSLLNAILPAGYTGPDLAKLISGMFAAEASGVGTSITWASGATSNISSDILRDLDAGLSSAGQGVYGGAFAEGGGVSPASEGFGFGEGVAVLGGLGSLFSLVQGAQANDPASIVQSVVGIYSALSAVAPATFTPITTLIGNAFVALAPEAATAFVQAAGGAIAGAAATGTEVAAAALAAAGPWLAIAGPLIQGLVQWAVSKDEIKNMRGWAVIGQVATALQSQAQTQLTQANAIFAALRGAGVTDPNAIKNALAMGSAALAAYYRKVQGPAGPIGISDFYAHTGQSPAPIQQAAAQLQQHMKDATALLLQGGATPESLGALGPSSWGDAIGGQPYSAALQAAPKIQPGVPFGQWVQTGQGESWVETGQMTAPIDQTQNVNQGIGLNESMGRMQAPDAVNTQYGGPFWTMWRYLTAGPGGPLGTPEITGAQPWLAGGAAPGTIRGPEAVENQLSIEEIRMLLGLAALAQGQFSDGGGAGTPGGDAASPPGTVGSGTGNSGGLGEAA